MEAYDVAFSFAGEQRAYVDPRPLPEDGTPIGSANVSFDFEVKFELDEAYNYDFRADFDQLVDEGSTPMSEGDFRITGGDRQITGDESGVLQPVSTRCRSSSPSPTR